MYLKPRGINEASELGTVSHESLSRTGRATAQWEMHTAMSVIIPPCITHTQEYIGDNQKVIVMVLCYCDSNYDRIPQLLFSPSSCTNIAQKQKCFTQLVGKRNCSNEEEEHLSPCHSTLK